MATTKNDYIVLSTKVETERQGAIDISTRIDGMEATNKELLEIKEVQQEAAQKIEKILNEKPAAGQ